MGQPFRLDRSLIRVSGPETVSFLQNLLTQNVENLDRPRYAALLSPQGKVFADMILWPDAGDIVIAASRGEDLMRRLTMYKLRAAVSVSGAPELALLWSAEAFDGAHADPRLPNGALGYRKLAPAAEATALGDGSEMYEPMRIAAGVPDLGQDAAIEEVFAGEALMEELNGVDFQKGCFVGQENVSRMKRRATTRRKFCPIVFDGAPPAFGAAIKAGNAEIGTVRTGMTGRAIALVRLDRAAEASEHNQTLMTDGRDIRLDPPSWLILPSREGDETAPR